MNTMNCWNYAKRIRKYVRTYVRTYFHMYVCALYSGGGQLVQEEVRMFV